MITELAPTPRPVEEPDDPWANGGNGLLHDGGDQATAELVPVPCWDEPDKAWEDATVRLAEQYARAQTLGASLRVAEQAWYCCHAPVMKLVPRREVWIAPLPNSGVDDNFITLLQADGMVIVADEIRMVSVVDQPAPPPPWFACIPDEAHR